jgi:hypothetical protein
MPSHQDKKSQAPSNFSKVPTANYLLGGSFYSHNMPLMFRCLVGRTTCHPYSLASVITVGHASIPWKWAFCDILFT